MSGLFVVLIRIQDYSHAHDIQDMIEYWLHKTAKAGFEQAQFCLLFLNDSVFQFKLVKPEELTKYDEKLRAKFSDFTASSILKGTSPKFLNWLKEEYEKTSHSIFKTMVDRLESPNASWFFE